jgi:hypothetical protein
MYSMKQLRMDACRASLHWDNFNGSEIEFTSFYRFYKAHISTTEPARARASGWLPPKSPGTPRLSAKEAGEGDLANWISHGIGDDIVNLLLKTALWLSLARGLAAVHLFCDVARLFVLHPPPMTISKEYRRFLLHLIRLRATTGGAQFSPSPIVPRDNKVFPGVTPITSRIFGERAINFPQVFVMRYPCLSSIMSPTSSCRNLPLSVAVPAMETCI